MSDPWFSAMTGAAMYSGHALVQELLQRHTMGFYHDRILPHLVHLAMRQDTFSAYRRRLVPAARGRVLEIGIGSGINLPLYTPAAQHVVGLDPSSRLLTMARHVARPAVPIELIEGSAEALPMEDESIDTVVTTWTLCTIPDVAGALREMRRVLKPSGTLLFVEHGRSPDAGVRRWQDRLTPLWRHLGGGCHLNRPIQELLETAGFRIERIETGYMPGPKPMTYMYEGRARPV
jgi:ubiquinone/menaquinone biosynthesis C-methylase UbiE